MKSQLVFCVFALFCMAACKSKVAPEVKAFLGSTVRFNGDLKSGLDSVLVQKEYNMLMYLDTADCVPCALNRQVTLLNYNQAIFEDTGIILLIKDHGNKEEIQQLLTGLKIDYPAFFDSENSLVNDNPALLNPVCKTFVIDRNNQVIWIGSPIQNDESLKAYEKMIKMLNKKKS